MKIYSKKNNRKIQTGEASTRGMRLDGTDDDEMANDPSIIAEEMEMETKCAAGQCKSIPDKNLMKIKVRFTKIYDFAF